MKLNIEKLALAVALLLAPLQTALAQKYPLPGGSGEAAVLCNGCPSNNSSGQPNDGLKTWPYDSPLVHHVGRIVDSTSVPAIQATYRTARANKIRFVREVHGTAPPRAYIQIGSGLGVYSLDRFFTVALPGGMGTISSLIGKPVAQRSGDQERVVPWDAWVYPELQTKSGWSTPVQDGQDRLTDFDIDDRGYVYLAMPVFKFGIAKDSGEIGGGALDFVYQSLSDLAESVVVVKTGSKYYSTTSGEDARMVRDVTNPSSPGEARLINGSAQAFVSWAKDDARERIAVVTAEKNIRIYDYAAFVAGSSPIATFTPRSGKAYKDVTVDENGNFWTTEVSGSIVTGNLLVKLARGSAGYSMDTYDVYGSTAFSPVASTSQGRSAINYGDKYLAVVGAIPGIRNHDVRLFRIEGGEPVAVDLHGFFTQYYHTAPRDYAEPDGVTNNHGAYPIKWNNKTYLIYQTDGLGDVFELEAGDSINVSQKSGTFGTANPNSKPTESGPFYGDILRFTATSSNPSASYSLQWNFDNTESGSDNTLTGQTGVDVEHQFTGLNTASKIGQTRHVKATATLNAEINDTVDVTLTLPTARIGIEGTTTVVTGSGGTLAAVAGDELTDASDGSVQGHFASWSIDGGTAVTKKPNETISVGNVGPHTVTLNANYGKYSDAFVTVGSPYVASVTNASIDVRPFVASLRPATTSGSAVTFKGAARVTGLTSVLSATNWTVTWTLKSASDVDIVAPQVSVVPVGQVPDFLVPNKSAITGNSKLKLSISVLPAELLSGDPGYATHEISQTLVIPDPTIAKSGCAETGKPCTLTASSLGGNSTTDWTFTWILKKGNTQVGSAFTGNPFKPSITEPGSYKAFVTASSSLFEGPAETPTFTVEGSACGPLPTATEMAIYTSCTTCDVGQSVTMRADSLSYAFVAGCDEFRWNFGDGSTATTTTRSTSHTYTSSGKKTVRLTIKKDNEVSSEYTEIITVGTVNPPCPIPSGITVSYSGSKGCAPGTSCKTGESIRFTAKRGTASLETCDDTSWSFGDNTSPSTSKSPSHTYSAAGSYTVRVDVTNESGSASRTITVPVVLDETGSCSAPPNDTQVEIQYTGLTSGCSSFDPEKICLANEQIRFKVLPTLGYVIQSCNSYDWNFGDNSAHSSESVPLHSYSGTSESYRATVRIYNNSNTTGNIIGVTLPFKTVPVKPPPVLTFSAFPSAGTKGDQVTFTVSSNIPATGWTWNFGDGPTDSSQAATVGTTSTMTHTFATKGTYNITVRARNADDTNNAPMSQVDRDLFVDDVPEHRYLIPVVAHATGIGSVWRTDIQLYTADSSISPANPLFLTASYKGVNYPLSMPKSTLILEDILDILRPGETEQGSMIISVKTPIKPQIWSRTYNQTEAGTFGQFIPAISLNETGGGSAVGEGMYYLAGLKSDGRYRTNVGLVNPNAQPITAIVRLYDDLGPIGQPISRSLTPFQLDQFPLTGRADRPFSVEIEVPAGTWVIGYASLIDGGSGDPVYMSAIRASELGSADYRDSVLPGVGHVGDWRSDITVYNSDARTVTVDLAYHDAAGAKVGEAKNIPIKAGEFLQYSDILKTGVFGTVPDGVGMLRVSVPSSILDQNFPMAIARTYNDNGTGKTYGQGISGFAANRANVRSGKSALIPGVRSNDEYYTNIGLTNVSTSVANVTVKVLDPNTGSEFAAQTYTLQPNQSIVGPQDIGGRANASLRIEVTGGNVWAFASIIDRGTKDPEYVPATPLP